jgi:phosphate transport system permease protein
MSSMSTGTAPPVDALRGLRGDPRRQRRERVIRTIFATTAILSVVVSALIIVSLFGGALNFLREVELSKLLPWNVDGWFPRRNEFDLLTLFYGTLVVTVVAIFIAGPVGLGAAVYLSEYARPRIRRLLKPILEVLAGVPSVVLGFFAISFLNPAIVKNLWHTAAFFNLMVAGIAVGILTIPLIASISEDAMRAVPGSLREAAYGLGSRKRTTVLRIVLPAALSGIVAAFILGVSRAIGETMVVAIASGATGGSLRPPLGDVATAALGPGQTMTAAMAALGVGTDQVRGAGPAFQSLFFVGLLLFVITLTLNVISARIVQRFQERY